MKQFELRLVQRDGPKIIFHEIIEGDSLIEVCSKIPLLIINIQQREQDELKRMEVDDDIPF